MAVVTFTYNPEPAPACYPADVNGLAQLLTQGGMLAGNVPDNAGGGIFVGSAPPSSSLTYKVWFKIDGAGRPLGSYMFYNGNWRKVYTNVGLGDVKMYTGSAANFDGTGRGIVGGETDGWALCNGNNGTTNMTDSRFPIGGAWNGSQWVATDQQGQQFNRHGFNHHQIQPSDLPAGLTAQAWSYPLNVASGSGVHIESVADPSTGGARVTANWPINQTQGSPNTPLPLPQFWALAFIQFIGYA